MYISSLFRTGRPVFSFEFFPPKTDKGFDDLRATIVELKALEPGFVSVTYGAGGSTRDRTIDLVSYIKNDVGMEAMAHLTCVGSSRAEVTRTLDRLQAAGIENVIALRGDPPQGQASFVPHPDGLTYASDLIRLIRAQHRPFCIAAAGYPETHVEAASPEEDLAHLVEKVDAGAEVIITQLFFDNACYFDFLERARAAGVEVPIVPGIMPITNLAQIERFTKLCGASIPAALHQKLQSIQGDSEAVVEMGVEHAYEQCKGLLSHGAPGIHFYTLNRSRSTRDIVTRLKAR